MLFVALLFAVLRGVNGDADLPHCKCLQSWTTDIGGTCDQLQNGCEPVACDGDAKPWCRTENLPCKEEEKDFNGGWHYCTPLSTASAAKCCSEWSAGCYDTASADNFNTPCNTSFCATTCDAHGVDSVPCKECCSTNHYSGLQDTWMCPNDCRVSENWSSWSPCFGWTENGAPTYDDPACEGESRRLKTLDKEARHGGAECPPMMESQTCVKDKPECKPAKCCSEWSASCYDTASADNHNTPCNTSGCKSTCDQLGVEHIACKECCSTNHTSGLQDTWMCPNDCKVSELWSSWSPCWGWRENGAPIQDDPACEGESRRTKTLFKAARHGGAECPPMMESETCRKTTPECEVPTVTCADILDKKQCKKAPECMFNKATKSCEDSSCAGLSRKQCKKAKNCKIARTKSGKKKDKIKTKSCKAK